jgi:AcrR family transcriptional regulator
MAGKHSKSQRTSRRAENPSCTRRASILRAAERLFLHYGFAKTTVADIAREAGVGVGTVYLDFPAKEAIIAELSLKRHRSVLDAMRDAAAGAGSASERLVAVFEARLHALADVCGDGRHGADILHPMCRAMDRALARSQADEEDFLCEFLSAATAAGELAPGEPRATARALLRVYGAYSAEVMESEDLDRVRGEIALLHQIILRGLLPRR